MRLLRLQVRTVAAFGMEQGTVDKYDKALEYPEKVRGSGRQHTAIPTPTAALCCAAPGSKMRMPCSSRKCSAVHLPTSPELPGCPCVVSLHKQVGITQGLLTGLSLGSLNLVLFSAYAASLYYGATRVAAGAMSGGDVLAVMMAALLGAYSLGQAAPLLQYFLVGRAAASRLTAVDRLQPGIDVDAPGQQLQHVSGELQLRGVCFMYPSLGVQVLDGVDLSIPAGNEGRRKTVVSSS
jgi:ABC-type multidrug transport system fused ATPase/permease subunit